MKDNSAYTIDKKSQLNVNYMFTKEELQESEDIDRFARQKAAKARAKALRSAKAARKLVPYVFTEGEGQYPRVGDSVAVCHRTTQNNHGDVRLERTSVDFSKVTQVFLGDQVEGYLVKVTSGDVWSVRPAAQGSAKWETFRVGEKQLVVVK